DLPGGPGDYRRVSRYNGFRNGGPGEGESGSIGFSLNNTVEAKVRTRNDSTGKKSEKVSLLNSLNLSGGYNLLADSLKLSNLSLSANTRFLKTFDINFSSTIDPYVYIPDPLVTRNIVTPGTPTPDNTGIPGNTGNPARVPDLIDPGVRINRYTWQVGGGLGNISNANIGISTNFQPGGTRKNEEARQKRVEDSDALPEEKAQIILNPNAYVDFNIPWTLNVSYSFNYSRQGLSRAVVSQTLSFSGDVKLTEKWKVGFNSGYDFVNKGISYTQLNIYRDLHCWEMSFNWTPFGARQSYSFTLNVRSSILKDLKLQRQRSFYDRNLGY
ncbi:MAG: LPS-assembly protein LptD, partial [Ferruginibacter sp.]|nr:LPS-assembly protein LptD [Cytophagales bacterium]